MFKVDDEYAFLTKDVLEEEYLVNGLSDKKIAEKYGIGSKATVWRRRKHYGIANKTPTKSNTNASVNRKFVISKEDAIKWQSEGKTYDEMAELVGCSRMVLYRRIKELGLTAICPEAMNKLRWHENLTLEQFRFLLGDLLGDGSLTHWGMYQCNHSYKQKSFIEYKSHLLSNLLSPNFSLKESCIYNNQNGKTYRKYYLRTMGNSELKKMHNYFYDNKVKIFPIEYLQDSEFDALSLAAWYMGDGGRKYSIPSLYTFGFGYDGNLQILMFLKDRFDIEGILREDNGITRNKNKRHYISIKKGENSSRFFSLVAPQIITHFKYKLPEEYRSLITK